MRGIYLNVFLIGMCLVVTIAARVPVFFAASAPLGGDEFEYYFLGVRLATGRGFTYVPSPRCPVPVSRCSDEDQSIDRALHAEGVATARRTPGLPLALAAIYLIGGDGYPLMRRVLVIISSLTAPALCCLCLLLFGYRSVALLAGLSWALLPTSHRLGGVLYGEALSALLVVVGLIATILTERRRSMFLAGSAGIVFGYAVLTRPYLLFGVLGPAVWLVLRRSRREAGVLLAVLIVLLGSWGIRNGVRMGTFGLTTETDALWGGNNAWARGAMAGDWAPQEAFLSGKYSGFERLDEGTRSRLYLREAYSEVVGNPGRILWLLPRKGALFLSPSSYLGFDWLYAILVPFSLVGAGWIARRREVRHVLWLVGWPIFGVLVVSLVAYGDPRVRHPVDPLFVVLACVGLVQLQTFLATKQRQHNVRTHPNQADQGRGS